jgi:hypothetical protein
MKKSVLGLIVPAFLMSAGLMAKELTSSEISSWSCAELAQATADDLGNNKASAYKKACDKRAIIKVSDVKNSKGEVVSKKVQVKADLEEKVESSLQLFLVKNISYTAAGKEIVSWNSTDVTALILDHREGKDLLISLLDNMNYANGDAGTSTFDPKTYDLEEDADKRKDNGEAEVYSTDFKDALSLLSDFDADEKFVETLKRMQKQKEVFGTITTTPDESCEESEYCSYGSVEVYLKDGTMIYVHFDFNT